jgi:chromosome segregation ATPase
LEELRKSITVIGRTIDPEDIYKKIKDQTRESQRLNLAVQDVSAKIDAVVGKNEEVLLAQKAMEEPRRQDAKRLADLQGELASVRKRADDAREKTTVHADTIRNLENRINELLETETTRQEAQAAFLAQQAMAQVERDRGWKDWQEKYELFKQQADNMESQVAALDDSIRAAKRAQDAYNDLNQKLERRIAEVSEMQRLAEDRIRQEWVAFKAEEQKRWTSHSLSQEESMRDLRKDMDKLEQRTTSMDDVVQTMQDQLHQTTDTTEKQLQELMNLSNEWLTTYERIMGHGKKTKKAAR